MVRYECKDIKVCVCLDLKASTGKKIDPSLSLNNQAVPYAPHGVKFLSLSIDVPLDKVKYCAELMSKLERMLTRINSCPLTRRQKLLIYRSGVCPHLFWNLSVEEFLILWVERAVD